MVIVNKDSDVTLITSKSSDVDAKIELGDDPTNGEYKLILSDEDTSDTLGEGEFFIEAKAKLVVGEVVTLLRRVGLEVLPSVIGKEVE